MVERYARLADDDVVFRLAREGGAFLPAGAVLPASGRAAGLSVWNRALTTLQQARAIRDRPEDSGFWFQVAGCRKIGAKFEVAVDVVADPLTARSDAPGWEGHSLLEGLSRPAGASKKTYRWLRQELVSICAPCD